MTVLTKIAELVGRSSDKRKRPEFLLKSASPGTKGELEFVSLAPCKDQENSVLLRSPEVLYSQRFLRVLRLHQYLALWASPNLARS